eukprot:365026_1
MDVHIVCGNTESCRYSTFDIIISIITNKFYLSCSSSLSCFDVDFNVPSKAINSMLWECSSNQACQLATITFMENVVINSFDLSCSADSSCREVIMMFPTNATINSYQLSCDYPACLSIVLDASTAVIADLNLHCSYCYYMDMNSIISNSVNINCTGSNACRSGNVNLIPAISDVNVNIECNGVNACHTLALSVNSEMNLLQVSCGVSSCGYMQLTTSNTSINDLKLDCTWCYHMYIYTMVSNSVNINCTGSNACQYSNVNLIPATSDVNVNVKCSGGAACHTLTLSVNSEMNLLQVSCGVSSCGYMQLTTSNTSINDLKLDCTWCYHMYIYTMVSNSVNINCTGSQAC